jgi:hypothetical protein
MNIAYVRIVKVRLDPTQSQNSRKDPSGDLVLLIGGEKADTVTQALGGEYVELIARQAQGEFSVASGITGSTRVLGRTDSCCEYAFDNATSERRCVRQMRRSAAVRDCPDRDVAGLAWSGVRSGHDLNCSFHDRVTTHAK